MIMHNASEKFSCIILAGGEGKRVGGVDKGLLEYNNKPLIEHVINAIAPQTDELIISANRNITRYKKYTDKVISDESETFLGPLAGISAALLHCRYERVLIVPCDTPFLPHNIIATFLSTKTNAPLYVAESNKKLQAVILMQKSLQISIADNLKKDERRLMFWVKSHHPQIVSFSNDKAFRNFNHNEDFTR